MKFAYRKIPRSADPKVPYAGIPLVPITMQLGRSSTLPFFALLDSGADTIIMADEFAVPLGIGDITTGEKQQTVGVGSQLVDVFFHDDIGIQLVGDGEALRNRVGFVRTLPNQPKVPPLLGRSFFKHFKAVSFDENGQTVELKPKIS